MAFVGTAVIICVFVLWPTCQGYVCAGKRGISVEEGKQLSLTCPTLIDGTTSVTWWLHNAGRTNHTIGSCSFLNGSSCTVKRPDCQLNTNGSWTELVVKENLQATIAGEVECERVHPSGLAQRLKQFCHIRVTYYRNALDRSDFSALWSCRKCEIPAVSGRRKLELICADPADKVTNCHVHWNSSQDWTVSGACDVEKIPPADQNKYTCTWRYKDWNVKYEMPLTSSKGKCSFRGLHLNEDNITGSDLYLYIDRGDGWMLAKTLPIPDVSTSSPSSSDVTKTSEPTKRLTTENNADDENNDDPPVAVIAGAGGAVVILLIVVVVIIVVVVKRRRGSQIQRHGANIGSSADNTDYDFVEHINDLYVSSDVIDPPSPNPSPAQSLSPPPAHNAVATQPSDERRHHDNATSPHQGRPPVVTDRQEVTSSAAPDDDYNTLNFHSGAARQSGRNPEAQYSHTGAMANVNPAGQGRLPVVPNSEVRVLNSEEVTSSAAPDDDYNTLNFHSGAARQSGRNPEAQYSHTGAMANVNPAGQGRLPVVPNSEVRVLNSEEVTSSAAPDDDYNTLNFHSGAARQSGRNPEAQYSHIGAMANVNPAHQGRPPVVPNSEARVLNSEEVTSSAAPDDDYNTLNFHSGAARQSGRNPEAQYSHIGAMANVNPAGQGRPPVVPNSEASVLNSEEVASSAAPDDVYNTLNFHSDAHRQGP